MGFGKLLRQDFAKKEEIGVGLYSDVYIQISFKLSMMTETTKLYILLSVWMTLTLIQGHSYGKSKSNFSIDLYEIQYVATTCRFVGAHVKSILRKKYSRTLLTRLYEIYD